MAEPHCVLYRGDEELPVDQDPHWALVAARAEKAMLWISLVAPTHREVEALGDALGLPALGIASVLRSNQRSKLDRIGDHLFLALQPAQYDDAAETVVCHEVDLIVGDHFFVAISADGAIDPERMRRLLDEHPEILRKGAYGVLWGTIEYVTRGYREVLNGVEHDIDEIEEELFGEDAGVSRRIFALQREVIDLQHAISPLESMLARLERIASQRRHTAEAPAFHEITERARYIDGRVTAFRQTLDNALTVHSTIVDQRRNDAMEKMTQESIQQNDQVKKISSWAAIGFAPTLVAGIYGMNFHYMPELGWVWGYPFAIALMVGVSTGLYFLFKRNDWL